MEQECPGHWLCQHRTPILGWVELPTLHGHCTSPEIAELFPVSVTTSTRPATAKLWLVLPHVLQCVQGTRWSCGFGFWQNDWEDPSQPQVCVHWSFLSMPVCCERSRGQGCMEGVQLFLWQPLQCTPISSSASLMASASRLVGKPYLCLLCCAAQHAVWDSPSPLPVLQHPMLCTGS